MESIWTRGSKEEAFWVFRLHNPSVSKWNFKFDQLEHGRHSHFLQMPSPYPRVNRAVIHLPPSLTSLPLGINTCAISTFGLLLTLVRRWLAHLRGGVSLKSGWGAKGVGLSLQNLLETCLVAKPSSNKAQYTEGAYKSRIALLSNHGSIACFNRC